jgi:hypothetical protein
MVVKTAEDRLRITTHGMIQVQKEIIPKIKANTNL